MTRSTQFVSMLLVVLATAACGAPTGNNAVDNDDASTNPNSEVAVREDVPLPQPDAPVITEDAGTITPDVAPIVEDRPSPPADDGMVAMMADLPSETCVRINQRCWGLPGERCERIVCRIRDGRRWLTLPSNLSIFVGAEARCYNSSSGEGICEGREIDGLSTGAILRDLNPTMDNITCTRPGQADVVIEGRPST